MFINIAYLIAAAENRVKKLGKFGHQKYSHVSLEVIIDRLLDINDDFKTEQQKKDIDKLVISFYKSQRKCSNQTFYNARNYCTFMNIVDLWILETKNTSNVKLFYERIVHHRVFGLINVY